MGKIRDLEVGPAGRLSGGRGITTMEYAVLLLVIILALLGMQTTLRRAISGKWRAAADTFGDGRQYEQGVTIR